MTLQTNSTGEAFGQYVSIAINVVSAFLYIGYVLNDHNLVEYAMFKRSIGQDDKNNKKRLEQVSM